ncbi:UNVERIFIED_CONTAM: nuc-1 [Trichonephila clavipes]
MFDLYSEIIGPNLDVNLIVETWRKGAGQVLEPFCKESNKVIDVLAINMTVKNKNKLIDFTYLQDHSKWAISQDSSSSMVCVADLNRMESQGKRGGGAMCFSSKPVWKAYSNIVDDSNSCPDN